MKHSILTAGIDDASDVARLIAGAFHDLAVGRWLAADPDQRLACMRRQFALIVAHAISRGQVNVTADRAGAAVWFDRTVPVPEPPGYDDHLREICGPLLERFVALDAAFIAHHPQAPHHHAAFLAVHPDAQGRGRGRALLEHHHRELDRQQIPAYLEASDTTTRDLYARFGYRCTSVIELPDGPTMWPMWREPLAR